MRNPLFLTWFLLIAGLFTLWCSVKNYDWFFSWGGKAEQFINMVGRKVARAFYILIALALIGWGGYRLVNPPPVIPTTFIFEFAKPGGIDLTAAAAATEALKQNTQDVKELTTDESGWTSFWTALPKDHPVFAAAAASAVAGPDFAEGFALPRKNVGERLIEGRIVYFNEALESCDNVLFSKRPLKSAAFVMVICSEAISAANGLDGALMVYYLRAGTEAYRIVTK